MNGLPAKLDQLEARLRALIEGNLAGMLLESSYREALIQNIVTAMKSATQKQPDGSLLAPDVYVLLVNPEVHPEIEIHSGLLAEFADVIREVGENAGLKFSQPPAVTVSPNSDIESGSIEIIARNSRDTLFKTVKNEIEFDGEMGNIPSDTFLIVNGSRIFSLDQVVVNIGRRSTNDLVIDDQRVSRDHAQMRAIRGKFVLFDLNSLGGTFVNGQRITRRTLNPRDVISLAGLPLVYGQDSIDVASSGLTKKMRLSQSDDDSTTVDNVL